MKALKVLAMVSVIVVMAVSCAKKEEAPAPAAGVDTTMTQAAPVDTTGAAAVDTTGAVK